MTLPYPDLLFQTRAGITPPVLWGVPFCETFFGPCMKGWETSARKTIYALNQLAIQKETGRERETESGTEIRTETRTVPLSARKIRQILDVALMPKMAEAGAFFVLAVARCLGALANKKVLTETEFFQWWEELESVALDAAVLTVEKEPLARILLAGELAETLVYVALSFQDTGEFSDFKPNTEKNAENRTEKNFKKNSEKKKTLRKPSVKRLEMLRKQAKMVLSESLNELLDGAGCPRAEQLPIFRMFVATWTRLRWLDNALTKNVENLKNTEKTGKLKNVEKTVSGTLAESIFDENSLSAYEWSVRMLMLFTRPDGALTFSRRGNKSAFWCPELFVAALKMDSDREDKILGVSILPDMKTPENPEKMSKLPSCVNYSPWGRVAVLQKNWASRTGAVVTWNRKFPKIEVMSRKVPIFSGEWEFSGSWNGRKLESAGEWRSVMWHSVEQGDYLELELKLTEGFTLQRQVFLARDENFLVLGEALSGDGFRGEKIQNGKLTWHSTLPISGGIKAREEEDALEILISCRNGAAGMALPLALPEWRKQLGNGNNFGVREI
ncbi:MAG: hypothetical protein Q4C70_15535, partial [Planctomycetia bacterium]|nr:hypothetical protein [Planctomycetia bacterium]